MGDWKAVRNSARANPIEIYDLKTDLGEKHDLAAEHPDLVKKFADYFQSAPVDSAVWPIKEKPAGKAANQPKKNQE
jgi:hypothetical protein